MENDPSALTVWGVFVHPELRQTRLMMIDAWQKHLPIHRNETPRNHNETVQIGDSPRVRRAKDERWAKRT